MRTRFAQLGELCDIDRRGLRPDDANATNLPFVGVENVRSGSGVLDFETTSRTGNYKSTTFLFNEYHVLYGKLRPYLNKVATPEFSGRCSTELVPLLPRAGVNRDFLAHLLRSKETVEFAMATVTGARMPRTDMNSLMTMWVPFPRFDEQQRIVDALSRAEQIHLLRAKASAHFANFVPALFVQMFGEPSENPMGWDQIPLGDLILAGPQNGLYRPKSDYGSGTPILRIDGFYDGRVTDPKSWQRVRLDDNTVRKYALSEEDIVINRVNSRAFLGKSAILPAIPNSAVFESNVIRITVDRNRLLPKLLIATLQLSSTRKRLLENAKDAINQSSINQSDVCKLPVVVPPLPLQQEFGVYSSIALSLASAGESAVSKAADLRTSLMSKLLYPRPLPRETRT